MSRTAGCFGKIPGLGDFVTRNLPRLFLDPWDAFLSRFMAGSRDALGEQWLDKYVHAPIWRFALPPGLAGESAVAGVLMPSVDRIGRYFPFTVAVLLPTRRPSIDDRWFDAAETLALDTLDDAFDPASLNTRLGDLGLLPCDDDECVATVTWATLGSQQVEPIAFRSAGLPDKAQCAALIDGDCNRWGWSIEPIDVPQPENNAAATA